MQFSVVIPTYNRASILEKTLQALSRQSVISRRESGTVWFEVLVADDGSADETPDMVRRLAGDYPVPLRYFRQPNRKQGAARNLGAQKARGSHLIFLGDDTVPIPAFVQEHSRFQSPADPRKVAIGYTPWAPDLPRTRFMEYVGERGWQFGFSLIRDPEDVPFNFFYTSNLCLSRSFFWEAGGFDEDFREYGWEDIELSWRLNKRGMRLVYNPRAVAHHYHPTTLASFIRRQRKVGFSAWLFYQKHPEMADFLNVLRVPRYTRLDRLKMGLLAGLCRLTETAQWPDLSRYYPDLMTYYYNLGIIQARNGAHGGRAG